MSLKNFAYIFMGLQRVQTYKKISFHEDKIILYTLIKLYSKNNFVYHILIFCFFILSCLID